MEVRELHSSVAKMMSVENITVEHNQYAKTAAFDLLSRKIILPVWKNVSSATYTLLIAHEVGHALHTPNYFSEIKFEDKYDNDNFRQILNLVEDARIEKKIFRTFPGVKPSFFEGYKDLLKINLFGDYQERLEKTNDIFDRINLYFKVGRYSNNKIEITERERKYIDQIDACENFQDVILVSKQLYDDHIKEEQKKQQEQQEVTENKDDSSESENQNENNDQSDSEESDKEQEQKQENSSSDSSEFDDESDSKDDSNGFDSENDTENEKQKDGENKSNDNSQDHQDDESENDTDKNSDSSDETDDDSDSDSESTTIKKSNSNANTSESEDESTNEMSIQEQIEQAINNLIADEIESKKDFYLKIDKTTIDEFYDRSFISYKKFIEYLKNAELCVGAYKHPILKEKREKFLSDSKNEINSLYSSFERKKKASQTLKNKTHNTGTLDFSKLHTYKFNENIFKRITVEQSGKNHGLIFFIDFSSSMLDSIDAVIEQLLILLNFCKRAQIKFEVYSFTSTREMNRIHLVNLFSSSMSKQDFDYISVNLNSILISRIMWGTPINITAILATKIYDQFLQKYKSEIINFIFLTDGDDSYSGFEFSNQLFCGLMRNSNSIIIEDRRKKKQFISSCESYRIITSIFYEYLREYTDNKCNIIKFDVLNSYSTSACIHNLYNNRKKMSLAYKKYISKILPSDILEKLLNNELGTLDSETYSLIKEMLSDKIKEDFYFRSIESGVDVSFVINNSDYVSAIDSIESIKPASHKAVSARLTKRLSKTRKNRAMIDIFVDYIA